MHVANFQQILQHTVKTSPYRSVVHVQIHHVHCTDGLLVANVSAIRPSRTLTCTGINRNADLSACHSLRMHMDVYLYMGAKGGESHRLHGCVIECQAWQFKMPSITKL